MALALYRKYRPAFFGDVVGQQMIVDTLRKQVAGGRVAHAYLFTGSRGTGKTSCARILAKAVNCLAPNDGNPCGACVCCRGVDDGSLTDVLEIDAASNNGVDSIRDLREEAYYTPVLARFRVYIIDEVHMLSGSAFNALLKIMEEPPEHVVFILSTTEIYKVPPTVVSRCQRFDFKRIENADAAERLLDIARREEIALTESGAMQIARLSDGALRDALSMLDVCRASGREIDAEQVAEAVGLVGDAHVFALAGCLFRRDAGEAVGLIEQLSQRSLEPLRLCEQLLAHLRALMLVKVSADPLPLIGCMPEQLPLYREQAREAPLGEVMACMSALGEAAAAIARTAAKRMELELAVVRLCTAQSEGAGGTLAERVEKLERELFARQSAPPVLPARGASAEAPPALPLAPAERPAMPPGPSPSDPELPRPPAEGPSDAEEEPPSGEPALFEAWGQVLSTLEGINRMNAGMLRGSRAYLSGRRVLIDCKDPVFLDMMRTQEETRAHVKRAIQLVTGRSLAIGPFRPGNGPEKPDPLDAFIAGLPADDGRIIINE